MFVEGIETAVQFTRPIHTIMRYFESTQVHPATATLFFVNADGWALTCKHVAEAFIVADQLHKRYNAFKSEYNSLSGKKRRQQVKALARKYEFGKGKLVELKNRVINCVDGPLHLSITPHPTLDVALLKFSGFTAINPTSFPVFAANDGDLKQGRFLCRLGFPFPEFSNFQYDPVSDTIDWSDQGRDQTPRFPIEGMVTRHLAGQEGQIVGFEMSTPGLRGQSGGPAFDTQGRVWGMQSATNHLDLNFDVDLEVYRDGSKRHVREGAVLHVGHCVHVSVLKEFMREHNVAFAEG
jgi:hypothetical protein